jgi:integrase
MAWLYQQKGSKKWWLGYRVNGKQILRSTKTSVRTEAERELEKVELLFGANRAGSLTEELFTALTGGGLPKITLVMEIDDWLAECRATTSEKTIVRYEAFAKEFKAALNATVKSPLLSQVTSDDIRRFLNAKRTATSAGTANLARKTLSAIFIRAVKNHHLRQNPVSPIKPFKPMKGEKVSRRAYSLEELADIYGKAPNDFWRYMIVGEFYTGLRMGDLICLRWGAVDLQKDLLVLKDDKTEKPLRIPIAKPMRTILAAHRAKAGKVKASDFIWPEQAARYQEKGSGVFSSEFYKLILTPLELVTPRTKSHESTGNGHAKKRQVNEVSFHSLRHSFVSFLRSTGSNQAVAKELAGHTSERVSDLYTHLPEGVLTEAISKLPEFVK